MLPFSIFLLTYDLVHLFVGVDFKSFLFSNALFILTYFSVIGFHYFINHYDGLGRIFKEIVILNALLVIIAIPFFFFPKNYQEWFWYINKLTKGVTDFPRLALFTYEASYYSLLLVPVLYYYVCKYLFSTFTNGKWFLLSLISIPMLLSFSFGVIGVSAVVASIMCIWFRKKLFRYKRAFIIFGFVSALLIIGLVTILYFFPNSFVAVRIQNVMAGTDTSTKGRTTESFTMAWRIASEKSTWFGAGLGQIKIVNVELVRKYYNYWGILNRYDIPNAMGETLAIFGVVGVIFRIFLEAWLFFKTKVYTNYYRLALFLFIFIYQFTGSFITNIAEYVIWILAFSPVFIQYNLPEWGANSSGFGKQSGKSSVTTN